MKPIKPVSISSSIWYFIISSLFIYIGLYKIIPLFMTKGMNFITGYFIFFYAPFVLMFITAFIVYLKEGNSLNMQDFKTRMRLVKMKRQDWLWALALIIFAIIFSVMLTPLANYLAKIPFFSPPDFFPAEINPNKESIPGYMMDYKLSGQYWVIIVYFTGWFFNIFGEELLWRGILLPRQIERYGSKTWIYHGLIWGLWHFFWKWNFITLLPFTLALSYVVYRRKNTWIGIISHGFINLIPLIMITIEVFG